MNILGENIKEIRERKGMSQKELAEIVGVTPQTISTIEVKGNTNTNTIEKIGLALGVPIKRLYEDEATTAEKLDRQQEYATKPTIEQLHPNKHKHFDMLPHEIKSFGQALSLEMYRLISRQAVDLLQEDVMTKIISQFVASFIQTLEGSNQDMTPDKIKTELVDHVHAFVGSFKGETDITTKMKG